MTSIFPKIAIIGHSQVIDFQHAGNMGVFNHSSFVDQKECDWAGLKPQAKRSSNLRPRSVGTRAIKILALSRVRMARHN